MATLSIAKRRLRLTELLDLATQPRLTTADEVRSWFVDRVPMVLPPQAVPLLDQWGRELRGEAPPSIVGWKPEGPGRTPVDAAPLIAWLRAHAESGEPFTFNALFHEKQGGRRYPYFRPGYDGPINISKNKHDSKKWRPRLLLSAMRRDVRERIRAPMGWSLIELDFKTCHAAIGVALSRDEQLAADVAADAHQLIGDQVARQFATPAQRREVGKALNLMMLFGATSVAVRKLAAESQLGLQSLEEAERVWTWWWSRYPRLAAFRDALRDVVKEAQTAGDGIEIEAPSGRVSKFSAGEVAGRVAKGKQAARGPDGVWRTIMSACFRAVEGDLLDATLRHFHDSKVGGQLVLPLYDGMIAAGPWGAEQVAIDALREAAEHASSEIGLKVGCAVVRRV